MASLAHEESSATEALDPVATSGVLRVNARDAVAEHRLSFDIGLFWTLATLVAAAAGAVLILLATSRNGPGITPDSVNYIGAARDFLHDGDMQNMKYASSAFGNYTAWPPLLPLMIALFSLGPGDFIEAARVVNAVA